MCAKPYEKAPNHMATHKGAEGHKKAAEQMIFILEQQIFALNVKDTDLR